MNHPWVLVVYNRPWHTLQVIESLSRSCPELLYIFCDGLKSHQDEHDVLAVRDIIAAHVTWTEPIIIEREENIGLARSVVSAVDYVLERHETIILLEDDCVVGPHFPYFMETCLGKYRDHPKILGVTGYTVPIPETICKSYPWDLYMFPRPGSWGWATWRNAWKRYDRDFGFSLVEAGWDGIDLTVGGKDIPGLIQGAIDGELDAWTPGWLMAVARYGYFIYPTVSHIQNIGMDGTGVHCGTTERYNTKMATDQPTRFPDSVALDPGIYENFRRYY